MAIQFRLRGEKILQLAYTTQAIVTALAPHAQGRIPDPALVDLRYRFADWWM